MLSKEEMIAFLALLLKFASTNGLSGCMLADLFGVSAPTVGRWLHMARANTEPTQHAFRYLAEPTIEKINRLNELDKTRGIYKALSSRPGAIKVETFAAALEGRLVW